MEWRERIIVENKLKRLKEIELNINKTNNDNKPILENELNKILNELKKDVIDKFKDESDIKIFLDNMINFSRYSYNNLMLIRAQRPKVEYATSLKAINNMGYKLNKGAKGIKILIPNFYSVAKIKIDEDKYEFKPYFSLTKDEKKRYKDKNDDSIIFYEKRLSNFTIGNVFDIKDTTIPIEIINAELNPVISDVNADDLIDIVIKSIYKDGFNVNYDDLSGSMKGYCNHKENTICIKKGLSNVMQLKVLVHEYAHALAHKHLEDNNKDYQKHRNQYETEAESIAYVVLKYLNLDTSNYTLSYLYAWSKEKDFQEIDDSLGTIINYSKRIINNLEQFYKKEKILLEV